MRRNNLNWLTDSTFFSWRNISQLVFSLAQISPTTELKDGQQCYAARAAFVIHENFCCVSEASRNILGNISHSDVFNSFTFYKKAIMFPYALLIKHYLSHFFSMHTFPKLWSFRILSAENYRDGLSSRSVKCMTCLSFGKCFAFVMSYCIMFNKDVIANFRLVFPKISLSSGYFRVSLTDIYHTALFWQVIEWKKYRTKFSRKK